MTSATEAAPKTAKLKVVNGGLMKKTLVVVVVLAVLGGGVALVILTRPSQPTPSSKLTTTAKSATTTDSKSRDACTILTLDDAKKLLGETAIAGTDNTNAPTESDALRVSTCTFIQDTGDSLDAAKSAKTASILARVPKNQAGTDSNRAQFTTGKPTGAIAIAGYGDAAYWDPQFGQLNILKSDTWYILSYGTTTISSRTADDTEQLAKLVVSKL